MRYDKGKSYGFCCDAPDCEAYGSGPGASPRGWITVVGRTSRAGAPRQPSRAPASGSLHLCPVCRLRDRADLGNVGFVITGGDAWEVVRDEHHEVPVSREYASWQVVLRGPQGAAERRYASLETTFRRGRIALITPSGRVSTFRTQPMMTHAVSRGRRG